MYTTPIERKHISLKDFKEICNKVYKLEKMHVSTTEEKDNIDYDNINNKD